MAPLADEIQARIVKAIPDAQVEVRDTTGSGDHFAVTVLSDTFRDKGALDRHRAVYSALGDLMKGAVHALALTTETPEEYKRT